MTYILLKISDYNKVQPFNAHEDTGVLFHLNFDTILRRDHKKNFPMSIAPMSR